jgi:predicted DNA-binding antitoxin AbrB/MazE fold protein
MVPLQRFALSEGQEVDVAEQKDGVADPIKISSPVPPPGRELMLLERRWRRRLGSFSRSR